MQPRSLPMRWYTSRCYITRSSIGKSVHLLLRHTMYEWFLRYFGNHKIWRLHANDSTNDHWWDQVLTEDTRWEWYIKISRKEGRAYAWWNNDNAFCLWKNVSEICDLLWSITFKMTCIQCISKNIPTSSFYTGSGQNTWWFGKTVNWKRWHGEFVLERFSSETQSISVAMEHWTVQHRAFAVETYFKNNDSVLTRRIFRRQFNIHGNECP
jgi:hypothetical protein